MLGVAAGSARWHRWGAPMKSTDLQPDHPHSIREQFAYLDRNRSKIRRHIECLGDSQEPKPAPFLTSSQVGIIAIMMVVSALAGAGAFAYFQAISDLIQLWSK